MCTQLVYGKRQRHPAFMLSWTDTNELQIITDKDVWFVDEICSFSRALELAVRMCTADESAQRNEQSSPRGTCPLNEERIECLLLTN